MSRKYCSFIYIFFQPIQFFEDLTVAYPFNTKHESWYISNPYNDTSYNNITRWKESKYFIILSVDQKWSKHDASHLQKRSVNKRSIPKRKNPSLILYLLEICRQCNYQKRSKFIVIIVDEIVLTLIFKNSHFLIFPGS